MPIAAVPAYLGNEFKDASPGMRFGMYLTLWGVNRRTKDLLWGTYDVDYEVRGQDKRERAINKENKVSALSDAKCLSSRDKETLKGLAERQMALATTATPERLLRLDAHAIAPFTTGLGNEHPLENGFAFLWPYGLPYLPGSGVKGVVRHTAQELAQGLWEDDRGWRGLDQAGYEIKYRSGRKEITRELSVLDVLFGRETKEGDSEHVRGALSFWDVIPQIAGDSLMVEIMTPHQSHYYQEKRERKSGNSSSPHDSGQPNPISFLTVPPGSAFHFFVVCDRKHLERLTQHRLEGAPDLLAQDGRGKPRWQTLLEAAFEHAFEWLGFGAKTAVGYGAMKAVAGSSPASPGGTASQQGEHRGQKPAAEPAPEQTWQAAKLVWKPGPGELTASFQGKTTMPMRGESAQKLIEALGQRANKLRKDKELANVAVTVREVGGRFELVGLAK
jgi:CRISPR-associated protein Cmr6